MAKVKLVSYTKNPVETVYYLWQASRHNNKMEDVEALTNQRKTSPQKAEEIEKIFKAVVESHIPVSENISFSFLLEDVSIALREQLVRHRIGVAVGDRVGMDIVPELSKSTFWSQSMRILPMTEFYKRRTYEVPESLTGKLEATQLYHDTLKKIQQAYNDLVAMGIPLEDARMLLPLACQHRISWTLNLSALQHIIEKRGCWILQGGLWDSVVRGIVSELVEKVDPIFSDLIKPPCIKNEKFAGCLFGEDNERRIDGRDEIPPCPLYLNYYKKQYVASDETKKLREKTMREVYAKLWKRNVDTGEQLK